MTTEKDYHTGEVYLGKADDEVAVQVADVEQAPDGDAVFGQTQSSGTNFRSVGWVGTIALMMKSQIGLGVLSIPSVFNTLGMIPGIICLLVIATLTTWSDYMVGAFKLRHREMYGIDDAGRIMFGRVGQEVFATAYVLYQTFCAGSGYVSLSVALNALSGHSLCTAAFVAIATVMVVCVSSIRTLGKISLLAWVGLICILAAIFTLTVAVGVQSRPAAAPADVPWTSDYKITGSPSFVDAMSAISSLVFSYAGTPSFFPIVAEMRDPRQYTRAMLYCQAGVTVVYLSIGIVVYYFCGSYVSSPALGSAGPLMKKVCYGLALPGLLMSSTLLTHLPAKYLYVRALRHSRHLTANTVTSWAVWMATVVGCAVFAYIVASAIPVFGDLVSLIGALLGTLMSLQPMGCMWLYDNFAAGRANPTRRWRFMVGWSVMIIVVGSFLMVAGSYATIVTIINDAKSGLSKPWTCADNS